MHKLFILATAFVLTTCLCGFTLNAKAQNDETIGYNLNQPNKVIVLSPQLHEISGVAFIGDQKAYCIQDGEGILYLLDIETGKILSSDKFGKKGDFEDLAIVQDTLYILRSDGLLYEINKTLTDSISIKLYQNKLPVTNAEGLCYDKKNDRLLIASKQGFIKYYLSTTPLRYAFEFDLNTKKLKNGPAYILNCNDAKTFNAKKGINQKLDLRPSALAIHPITGEIYILSADDYMLFVYAESGKLLHTEKLQPQLYNKAEGISFKPNGDMIICNEGKNQQPTLIHCAYLK